MKPAPLPRRRTLGDRNFAVLEVNGPRRACSQITILDTAGNEVWNRSIEARDLQ